MRCPARTERAETGNGPTPPCPPLAKPPSDACPVLQAASQTKIDLKWHIGMAMDNWNKLVDKEHMDVLVAELGRLELMADALYEEITWIREKESEMRDLNEAINTKVVFFSAATLFVSIVLSVLQLVYLKRFFKAKKVL